MGITVGCMATSMHVMPIGGEGPSSGPSQWTMTSSDGRRLSLTELKDSIKVASESDRAQGLHQGAAQRARGVRHHQVVEDDQSQHDAHRHRHVSQVRQQVHGVKTPPSRGKVR